MPKPILCLDFDGVIHSYSSGWQGAQVVADDPVSGALAWIWHASKFWEIHIYSSRSSQPGGIEAMKRWFRWQVESWLTVSTDLIWRDSIGECVALFMFELKFPQAKPSAFLTIDDRAIQFRGNWSELDPEQLLKFKPWNKE